MIMFDKHEIRKLRQRLGMTPTIFASKLGVSENTVRRWEIGDRHPRRSAMIVLNRMLRKLDAKTLETAAR